MAKGSKRQRKSVGKSTKTHNRDDVFREEDIDDEVDDFHKQRDLIPLDANDEADDSDEDMEQPIFDFEGADDDDSDSSRSDDDDAVNDDIRPKGFAAKIARQAKYLQQKFGGVDDEMDDNDVEQEEERKAVWGRKKNLYYSADNVDYELQSSDEDLPMEEEAEVVKIQREKAKFLSVEDFGLEDADQVESDSDGQEKAFHDAFAGKKAVRKCNVDAVLEDSPSDSYEEIKKDLNALSKEEQMDVVYSSAPELVGLLTELNGALNQLKQVKPLLSEYFGVEPQHQAMLPVNLDWHFGVEFLHQPTLLVNLDWAPIRVLEKFFSYYPIAHDPSILVKFMVVKEKKDITKGGMNYLEVKYILLLTYCQAIGFYLLLKSEGHPVRDHPVIARLVEINNLLEKMKQIDMNLRSQTEEIVSHKPGTGNKLAKESVPSDSEPDATDTSVKPYETSVVNETAQLVKDISSKDLVSKNASKKQQDVQVDFQSMEMLKVRANLEAKLKQKGIYNFTNLKPERTQNLPSNSANQRLETLADFDDEVLQTAKWHCMNNGHTSLLHLGKPSQPVATKLKRQKFVSGDDDLPKRDDIGERRRKFELQVLARAGTKSEEDRDDDMGDEEDGDKETRSMDVEVQEEDGEALDSEDEFYKQVKKQRAGKLMAKAQLYSRTPAAPSPLLETEADGKRQISYQMEKNRGLTRSRKKLTKNPRKKYKIKHQKAVIRRKGQVRDIRKPMGPYGGEASGVNISVSRSIRFKS